MCGAWFGSTLQDIQLESVAQQNRVRTSAKDVHEQWRQHKAYYKEQLNKSIKYNGGCNRAEQLEWEVIDIGDHEVAAKCANYRY
jgi:hypothetical protein